jgi:hypothetical protein
MLFKRFKLRRAKADISMSSTTRGINPSINFLAIFREKK